MSKATVGKWLGFFGTLLLSFQMLDIVEGHPFTTVNAIWMLVFIAAIIIGAFLIKYYGGREK